MAESDPEKSEADVSEAEGERPAPDFRQWRKSKGMDGLKLRSLRAMKAAEEMLYSAETRTEAADAIKLLTQATNSHRRVLRDEHRAEMETGHRPTETQLQNFALGAIATLKEVFADYDVPREAQHQVAERLGELTTRATSPPALLDE